MNDDALMLAMGGLAGGLLGALWGGLLVWRQIRARLARDLPMQLGAAMAPLLGAHLERMQSNVIPAVVAPAALDGGTPSWVESVLQAATAASRSAARAEQCIHDVAASAAETFGSHQAAQLRELRALQDRIERWQQAVEQASRSAAAVVDSAPSVAPAATAAAVIDLEPLLLQVGATLDVHFDAQGQAWQALLQRIPQALQQALQVELDFLAQQQAHRDAAASLRDDERAAALVALIGGLGLSTASDHVPAGPGARSPAPALVPVPRPVAPSPRAVSARPPELLLTPLPRPEPIYDEPEPEPELSDEELDALPPELPVPDRPRRRILPAPKKPVLRNL
ncbi:hypothetical protein [Variovorax boronicumulans]|uniref:hypothetical protein n=1 Tax=Variovorax boronicumulans TaxID=436515 RepID=UPI001C579438